MKEQPFLKTSLNRELFEACHVLFGSNMDFSLDFLQSIQPSRLKTAYRERALQTHPDRAVALGVNRTLMGERFREVSKAYEKLRSALDERGRSIPKVDLGKDNLQSKTASVRPKPDTTVLDHFYKGGLPKRTLRFGQFLYYSSHISWRQLIKAISWQRLHRPLIGQIARQSGMLSTRDISHILLERNFMEKFGECALRKGYLIPFRLHVLLGKQRRFQVPFGRYFLENGIFRAATLERLVLELRVHNRKAFLERWT